jgi:hypothetical protein
MVFEPRTQVAGQADVVQLATSVERIDTLPTSDVPPHDALIFF